MLTLVVGLATACGGGSSERVEVRIGGLVVRAELARTPEERVPGLSGRPSLRQDGGMLFVFPTEQRPGFWMKDMRFPLDFVWISAGRHVAGVTENVPPPSPGTADSALPLYSSDSPVLYVLEVNGGAVRRSGVRVGDPVTFTPEVTLSGVR